MKALNTTECTAQIVSTKSLKKEFGNIPSPLLFGAHNQENLLRATGVGKALGLGKAQICDALSTFPGISSRFEYKGTTKKGMMVYKDFAHNPQKIRACLAGAKEAFPKAKLVVAYQPHNFERTFTFHMELIASLKDADVVIIPNIYSVREGDQERSLITCQAFVDNLRKEYPLKQVFFSDDKPPYTPTINQISEFDQKNTVLLLVSAGDLDQIFPHLLP